MTTQKIKLLHHFTEHTNLSSPANNLIEILNQYFDVIYYEPGVHYNPADTVLVVPQFNTNLWWQPFVDKGFKMIIDNVTEVPEIVFDLWIPITDTRVLAHKPVPESAMVLQSPNFFRYEDASKWLQQGYDQYRPQRKSLYKALLLMNRKKRHRTWLIEKLGTQLDQCVWSYIEQGKQLNHTDVPITPDVNWMRYVNPDWFDQCCVSIVAESLAEPPANRLPFVTEKTWKSVAMQHPFMIVGEPGTLQHLHSLGFETFENLWSEDYDTTQFTFQRIDQVVKNLAQYNMAPLDQLTLQKLEHNRNHLFNREIIHQFVIDEIINPILEYVSK
jgi:hypothetical protein